MSMRKKSSGSMDWITVPLPSPLNTGLWPLQKYCDCNIRDVHLKSGKMPLGKLTATCT